MTHTTFGLPGDVYRSRIRYVVTGEKTTVAEAERRVRLV
jgi:hypothetical protein